MVLLGTTIFSNYLGTNQVSKRPPTCHWRYPRTPSNALPAPDDPTKRSRIEVDACGIAQREKRSKMRVYATSCSSQSHDLVYAPIVGLTLQRNWVLKDLLAHFRPLWFCSAAKRWCNPPTARKDKLLAAASVCVCCRDRWCCGASQLARKSKESNNLSKLS